MGWVIGLQDDLISKREGGREREKEECEKGGKRGAQRRVRFTQMEWVDFCPLAKGNASHILKKGLLNPLFFHTMIVVVAPAGL